MKKSRFKEEQIIGVLKQHEAGMKTADLCREHGVSAATFYGWKAKYGGMDVSEAAEGDGRREPAAEASGRGPEPEPGSAEGRHKKKPMVRRWLASVNLDGGESAQIYSAYVWAEPWPG